MDVLIDKIDEVLENQSLELNGDACTRTLSEKVYSLISEYEDLFKELRALCGDFHSADEEERYEGVIHPVSVDEKIETLLRVRRKLKTFSFDDVSVSQERLTRVIEAGGSDERVSLISALECVRGTIEGGIEEILESIDDNIDYLVPYNDGSGGVGASVVDYPILISVWGVITAVRERCEIFQDLTDSNFEEFLNIDSVYEWFTCVVRDVIQRENYSDKFSIK